MLTDVDVSTLKRMGPYKAAVQRPLQKQHNPAKIVDTYPPWEADLSGVAGLKQWLSVATENESAGGDAITAGGEQHKQLLKAAKTRLEEDGFSVILQDQRRGVEMPDGEIQIGDDALAHLEAESSTLSKPARTLKNLRRGLEQSRKVVFAVHEDDRSKLESILEDPVNRNGSDHEDEDGSFSYYTDDGEPVSDVDELREAEWDILAFTDNELQLGEQESSEEGGEDCPMIGDYSEEELQIECTHRDSDGYCSKLDSQCVVTAGD
jgi:hypothetical protein